MMRVIRIDGMEYNVLFPSTNIVFNSVAFSCLNEAKCEDLHFVKVCDEGGKARFGVILGRRGDKLLSPFSAPFGSIVEKSSQRISFYGESVAALKDYAFGLGCKLCFTLPPDIYDEDSSLLKQECAMLSNGGHLIYSDYNFHYPLERFGSFRDYAWKSTVRNLSKAFKSEMKAGFISEPTLEQKREIYKIVEINHSSMGYPVHMSFDDILRTSEIVPMDYFLVKYKGTSVASAIIYHTSASVVQLIYWGDIPEYRYLRPMNLLAYTVLEHYAKLDGVNVFDFGPASSDGVPSLGLCDFKEGLGCILTKKDRIEF